MHGQIGKQLFRKMDTCLCSKYALRLSECICSRAKREVFKFKNNRAIYALMPTFNFKNQSLYSTGEFKGVQQCKRVIVHTLHGRIDTSPLFSS